LTGRATLHTILIDRPAFYSTRALGLYTYSQTALNLNSMARTHLPNYTDVLTPCHISFIPIPFTSSLNLTHCQWPWPIVNDPGLPEQYFMTLSKIQHENALLKQWPWPIFSPPIQGHRVRTPHHRPFCHDLDTPAGKTAWAFLLDLGTWKMSVVMVTVLVVTKNVALGMTNVVLLAN